MKNGVCPKCLGREVYSHPGSRAFPGEAVVLDGFWMPSSTTPDKYVCAGCGYLEYYIPNESDLLLIREKWQRVPSQ